MNNIISGHRRLDEKSIINYIDINYDGNVDSFIKDINSEFNRLLRTDLRKARRYLKTIDKYFKLLPDKYRPRKIAINARFFQWIGQHKDALAEYKKAIDLNQRHRNYYHNALLRKGLMNSHLFLGNYQEALKAGKTALRYFRRKGLNVDAAQTLSNIGNIYHRMDNNTMALRYYDLARDIYKKIGGHGLAIVEYNRANIYANLNNVKKAHKLYSFAAELYKKSGMHIAENQAYYSIAYLYYIEDRLTEALKIFEDIYEKFINLGDVRSGVMAKLDLVEVNIALNQYGTALLIANEIIPLLKKLGMTYELAKTHYFIFQILFKFNEYSKANESLRKSYRLFSKENNKLWIGMIHIARSNLMLARKKWNDALQEARKAQKLFKANNDIRRWTDARITLIESNIKLGRIKFAIKLAMDLKKSKLLGYQKYALHNIIGNQLFSEGKFVEALKYYKVATREIEKMLAGLYPDEMKYFFLYDKYDSYIKIIDCLIKIGKVDYSLVERLKFIELTVSKDALRNKKSDNVPPDLLEKREKLKATLKKMYQASVERQRGLTSTSRIYSVENKLWDVERKVRSYLYPEFLQPNQKSKIDRDFIKYIRDDEILINYIIIDSRLVVFLADAEKIHCIELADSTTDFNESIRKLNFICEKSTLSLDNCYASSANVEHYLEKLYNILIKPVEKIIDDNKIYFLIDSHFSQIPFGALKRPHGQFLKDRFKYRIIINPDVIVNRTKSKHAFNRKRNSVFAPDFKHLPNVKKEAKDILNYFDNAKIYMDNEAITGNLYKELKKTRGFIHIATHASRSCENPLFSQILMNDGPFFPFNLFDVNINADLVTLSGCQTAAPGLYYGESFSLAAAFGLAGSKHILATLWSVSDVVSKIFMNEFYNMLAKKQDIFIAYKNAADKVYEITENPAHWGAFVLISA